MIVVTTPTGQIGSQVVQNLLAANQQVRVIVRDPAKLAAEVRSKVDAVQGSSDDESVLSKAFEGAESLFWVVPPFVQDEQREGILPPVHPARVPGHDEPRCQAGRRCVGSGKRVAP